MDDKIYIVDISSLTCWNNIVLEFKPQILKVLDKMRPLFSQYTTLINVGLTVYRLAGGIFLYEKEMNEISRLLNITFTECLLFQLTYELCSACTSSILKIDTGEFVHVRTMDWEMPELKALTINIKVVNSNTHLFDAVTWAGFIGIFTGIKPNQYSISLNYRRTSNPNFLSNVKSAFQGYYPNSFFIRDLLSTCNDEKQAFDRIKLTYIIAPAYYTFLSDTIKCSIIRDRTSFSIKEAPCVQTNCDGINQDDNIMHSFERITYMNNIITIKPSLSSLIKYINQWPIQNNYTIYTVIMTPNNILYFNI